MSKCYSKTRFIRVVCLCIIFSIAFCSFAFGSTYEEYDQDGNYLGPTNQIGSANNTNYLLSKISYHIQRVRDELVSLGVQAITANQHLSNIYNSIDDVYTRLGSAVDYLQYIYNNTSTANTHLNNISSYVNTIRSNSNTDLTLQTSQLTQLQQINTKLDVINSVNWTNINNILYEGMSLDGISFNNVDNLTGESIFVKISNINFSISQDVIFHVRLPNTPGYINNLININFIRQNNVDVSIINYFINRYYTDIYLKVNRRGSSLSEFIFNYHFGNDSRPNRYLLYYSGSSFSPIVEYINSNTNNYYDVYNAITNLYYLDQISNKLDNIEVSVDTSDIVDAINALDITQDIDVDLSQDITQTTNLITQLRNLFGTGVSIPQFVQQTQDQSFLGWFSQSNSDDINHISIGYNEAPY